MSSDCVSSETEGSPVPSLSLANPSWWSDSDGRRSARDTRDADESPWWESECEPEKPQVYNNSPNFSPGPCEKDSSTSSVTPTWWSEPSSRQPSTSATEIEVDSGRERSKLKSRSGAGSGEEERGCDGERIKLSVAIMKNRKRLREQSNDSNICQKEPPSSKQKLEPPSPHADPVSVLQDLKRGICGPLQSFFLFFTVDLLTRICDLTNADCWERILEEPLLASKDGSWEEVTVKEMYAFLAVILIMRGQQDVCFGAFWREQPGQQSHWPRDLMKRSRFFTLLQVVRLTTRKEDCDAVKMRNRQTGSENQAVQTQSAFSEEDGSPLKELKYVFDQIERIFKVFYSQFEFQCFVEISLRDGEGFRGEILNYMKILPPSCEVSLDGTKMSGAEVDSLNPGRSTLDESPCNRTITVLEVEQSNGVAESNQIEAKSGNGHDVSKLRAKNCEQGEKESDHVLRGSKKLPSVKSDNNGDPKTTHVSNVVNVRWHDGSLNVTSTDATSSNLLSIKSEDGMGMPPTWNEVFVPCPELVLILKDHFTRMSANTNSDSTEGSSGDVLGKSFFYHYLHLAVYFSTSKDVRSLHSRSEEMLSESDSLEQIIEGLVLLGKPDSILRADLDTDTSEAETSRDSTSTNQSDGADDCKDRETSHRYVPARSRMSRNCALCWSLHRESHRVHTRCTRCGWPLCMSRFRNCMEEAHRDQKIMNQLWDKGTGDVQCTSDVKDAETQ